MRDRSVKGCGRDMVGSGPESGRWKYLGTEDSTKGP